MRDSKKTNGISLIHYKNPVSQQNDVTMVIFDLRIFEHEMAMMKQPTQAFQNMMGNQNPIEQETHGSIDDMLGLGGNNQTPMNSGALNLGVSNQQPPPMQQAWGAPQQAPFGQAAQNPFMQGMTGGASAQWGQQPVPLQVK